MIGCVNRGGSIRGLRFTLLRCLEPKTRFVWSVRAVALVNLATVAIALLIILPYRLKLTCDWRSLVDLGALRERNFRFFALALLLDWIVFCIAPFYIPIFAIPALQEGQDHAFDSLALVSVESFSGRILPMLTALRFRSIQVLLGASVAAFIVPFS